MDSGRGATRMEEEAGERGERRGMKETCRGDLLDSCQLEEVAREDRRQVHPSQYLLVIGAFLLNRDASQDYNFPRIQFLCRRKKRKKVSFKLSCR